jgi:Tfp pilus assembly protein PilN
MAEIINLNRARKAKARIAAKATAVENRAKFGASRQDKAAAARERQALAKIIDGAKLDPE